VKKAVGSTGAVAGSEHDGRGFAGGGLTARARRVGENGENGGGGFGRVKNGRDRTVI
jgi:hypothetical protein